MSEDPIELEAQLALEAYDSNQPGWRVHFMTVLIALADKLADPEEPSAVPSLLSLLGMAFADAHGGARPNVFAIEKVSGRPPANSECVSQNVALASLAVFERELQSTSRGMTETVFRNAARRFNSTMAAHHSDISEDVRISWQNIRSAYNNRFRLSKVEIDSIEKTAQLAHFCLSSPDEGNIEWCVLVIGMALYSKVQLY